MSGQGPAGVSGQGQGPAGVSGQGPVPGADALRRGRRRVYLWAAFLSLPVVCAAVVVWAALAWNGGYPTVAPPVPRGWQAVPGIYASFSTPKGWSLQQAMSDSQGDIYYSGQAGAAGESVRRADRAPSPAHVVPAVVASYLGGKYEVTAVDPIKLRHAETAWEYSFRLPGYGRGLAILAWVKRTESEVWLVALPASPTAEKILSTLTLAG